MANDNRGGDPAQSKLNVRPKVMDRPVRINGAATGPGQLDKARGVFRKWFGDDYDMAVLDSTVAVGAGEQLQGDPAWLMHLGPPGAGKTETISNLIVMHCAGAPVIAASNISSSGSFLSATKASEKKAKPTGGILREIGDRGILLIKDFTSIMSLGGDKRAEVIAALREIADGSWVRKPGNEGGQSIPWQGRLVIVAACTPASWDKAHTVIAEMGPRFLTLRSTPRDRGSVARRAMANLGDEVEMRAELRAAFRDVLSNVDRELAVVTKDDERQLIEAADFVATARTPISRDYQGVATDIPFPEVPTRIVKQLAQVVRGGLAIGMPRPEAMALTMRIAHDCIPPLRSRIIADMLQHDGVSKPNNTRIRLQMPFNTVKREFEAMRMLGLMLEGDDYHMLDPNIDSAIRLLFSYVKAS